ncbi:MAG: CBS domain-containing protein [Longimicrobiales bacterium]
MSIKIADVMHESVVTTVPHKSLGHVRDVMSRNKISSVPVVDSDNEVVGIVTTSDLAKGHDEGTPVSQILGDHVYTVPAYNPVHIAARIMRNHHIHHVVVTHEQKVVGIVSSFDLLKLVDDHQFVMKNRSTPKRGKKKN